jgi:hypothetical protein
MSWNAFTWQARLTFASMAHKLVSQIFSVCRRGSDYYQCRTPCLQLLDVA